MRKTYLYLIGGQLATISIPVVAQEAPVADIPEAVGQGEITPEALAQVQTWPAERPAAYEAWPQDAQAYFWTLNPERQELFWRLQDADKFTLVAMDDVAREEAWTMVESRMQAMGDEPDGTPPTAPAPVPEPGDAPMPDTTPDTTSDMPGDETPDDDIAGEPMTDDASDPDSIPR